MEGPHRLTTSNIDSTVDDKIGVYMLYNSRGGPVQYVGMSTELANRLKDWTDTYSHFEYGYRSSRTQAYRSAAHLYHRHGGTDELDNEEHPPRPHRQVKCPVCGIHS